MVTKFRRIISQEIRVFIIFAHLIVEELCDFLTKMLLRMYWNEIIYLPFNLLTLYYSLCLVEMLLLTNGMYPCTNQEFVTTSLFSTTITLFILVINFTEN